MVDDQALLNEITEGYLNSRDFNGYSVHRLKHNFGLTTAEAKEITRRLPEFFSTMQRRRRTLGQACFGCAVLQRSEEEEQAIAGWQIKRDGTSRGIIEITEEQT